MNGKWAEFEGCTVAGRRLDNLLGVRGSTGFYLTRDTGDGDKLVEVVIAGEESASITDSWNCARNLSDMQLMEIHQTGGETLDGTRVAYAVLDLPQDDLGEMLNRGTLSERQARTMFSAVARALETLHHRGLCHGALTPANILVVDGDIRLSADTLAQAGKREKERDLRQFAASMSQALTGRSDAVGQLASPFREIATGCLSGSSKWTASRIREALDGTSGSSGGTRRQAPIMVSLAIGIVVLLSYIALHRPVTTPVRAKAPPVAATPAPKPAPRAAAPTAAPRVPTNTAAAVPTPAPKPAHDSWVIIICTYHQYEAAQKHAQIYHEKFPQTEPRVFPAEGQAHWYFVVIGSGLTQQSAESLRHDLIEQGAPPDSYVAKIAEN